VWNSHGKSALAAVRELFWGMLGRGDGGLRVIGVSGSEYNEVRALEVLNVVDFIQRKRRAELPASASAPHAVASGVCISSSRSRSAVVPGVLACVHMYSCAYVCVCICVYVYIYVHFFAVGVACTLERVFWAPTHVQLYALYRCSFDINVHICNAFAAGCAHVCIYIYMCICMHMCMNAYEAL